MFELPKLNYGYDELSSVIDAETMKIHHTAHHATYVAKLNDALQDHPDLQNRPIEEILREHHHLPKEIQGAVRNHGGGHHNHSLFWESLSPKKTQMSQEFADAIDHQFGSLENLQNKMIQEGLALFGSGWVWLCQDRDRLGIITRANQDSPLMDALVPILGIDVWEHAYYLRYQNRRAEYLEKIWDIIHWHNVSQRYSP